MKASIVIAVLNSPEMVRRQLLHFSKLNMEGVEVLFVDDGSTPPINKNNYGVENFSVYTTNNFNSWTQPAARNFGAEMAKGEYCIFTDIDHIITEDIIETVKTTQADVVRFKRQVGVLDKSGNFSQDWELLKEYGYVKNRLSIRPHSNSYMLKRDLFLSIGGNDLKRRDVGTYPNREEVPVKRKLKKLAEAGEIKIIDDKTKPTIYMVPNGHYCGEKDYNPFGLFHSLKR